jgi:hypothetical protein
MSHTPSLRSGSGTKSIFSFLMIDIYQLDILITFV